MDVMQSLPSFDIQVLTPDENCPSVTDIMNSCFVQHDTLEVFEDVAQDTVEQESIWISCVSTASQSYSRA